MIPRVKICGVCDPADAHHAAAAGAAYVGVILAPGRTRSRTVAEAAAIFDAAAPALRVGVFVDAPTLEVRRAVEQLGLDVVQLHGDESLATLAALKAAGAVEVWKAVRVRVAADVERAAAAYLAADGLLLDGWSERGHGGVGAAFDWAAVAPARRALPQHVRVIAAGGLTPANVATAIAQLAPDVVDVSSGVERQPCRKAPDRVEAFIAAAGGVQLER